MEPSTPIYAFIFKSILEHSLRVHFWTFGCSKVKALHVLNVDDCDARTHQHTLISSVQPHTINSLMFTGQKQSRLLLHTPKRLQKHIVWCRQVSHHVKELDASTARCHTHAQDCDECDAWRKRKTTLPCPNPIQEAFLLHQDVLTQWHLKHLQMHHTHAWHLISITHEHTHTPPRPRQDSRPEYRSLHTHTHTHTYSHVHTHTHTHQPCPWNYVRSSPALLSLLSISRCAAVCHGGWRCCWGRLRPSAWLRYWLALLRTGATLTWEQLSVASRAARCWGDRGITGVVVFVDAGACVWPGLVPRAVNGSCRKLRRYQTHGRDVTAGVMWRLINGAWCDPLIKFTMVQRWYQIS